jgi:hypothetical protein
VLEIPTPVAQDPAQLSGRVSIPGGVAHVDFEKELHVGALLFRLFVSMWPSFNRVIELLLET